MKSNIKGLLYWSPRVLGILVAIFVSLFALDVFGEGYNFWETIIALAMHLIPTAIILIILAIAWRRERIGGFLFIVLGVLYIALFWDPSRWPAYLIISGPLFLTGLLFIFDGYYREKFDATS
jgi:TctA family transporter